MLIAMTSYKCLVLQTNSCGVHLLMQVNETHTPNQAWIPCKHEAEAGHYIMVYSTPTYAEERIDTSCASASKISRCTALQDTWQDANMNNPSYMTSMGTHYQRSQAYNHGHMQHACVHLAAACHGLNATALHTVHPCMNPACLQPNINHICKGGPVWMLAGRLCRWCMQTTTPTAPMPACAWLLNVANMHGGSTCFAGIFSMESVKYCELVSDSDICV